MEPMKTITLRMSAAEVDRLDQLAAALAEADRDAGDTGYAWGMPKLGRGDVVRLALMHLDPAGDDDRSPFRRAQLLLYRAQAAAGERVTRLEQALRDREPGQPAAAIPGQMDIEEAIVDAARAKAAPRKKSQTRRQQVLELVSEQPGITIPELAERMGVSHNYLYRLMPALMHEREVTKSGRGWYPHQREAVAA